ncbi:MAG: NlpC/P60 family protein [Vicinamibacterales bacterium]
MARDAVQLGGNSKSGVDCSAFVKAVYVDVYGVELPRTAEEQERLGRKVDRKELQPGDLIFFRTKGMGPFFKSRHVGVYVGGGEFAQASGRLGVNIVPLSNRVLEQEVRGRQAAADRASQRLARSDSVSCVNVVRSRCRASCPASAGRHVSRLKAGTTPN